MSRPCKSAVFVNSWSESMASTRSKRVRSRYSNTDPVDQIVPLPFRATQLLREVVGPWVGLDPDAPEPDLLKAMAVVPPVAADVESDPVREWKVALDDLEPLPPVERGNVIEVGVGDDVVDLAPMAHGVVLDFAHEIEPLAMPNSDFHGDGLDADQLGDS